MVVRRLLSTGVGRVHCTRPVSREFSAQSFEVKTERQVRGLRQTILLAWVVYMGAVRILAGPDNEEFETQRVSFNPRPPPRVFKRLHGAYVKAAMNS